METLGDMTVAGWIVQAGLDGKSEPELLAGFSDRLRDAGVPLARGSVLIDTLHPIHEGRVFYWRRDERGYPAFREYGRSQSDQGVNDAWLQSPFRHLHDGKEDWLRCRLTPDATFDFPVIEEMREQGLTDYLAMIHRFSTEGTLGEMDCIYSSWASDLSNGFSEADLALIRKLAPPLGLAMKAASLTRIARTLVETYVGRDAGRRVLAGKIERGVAERISAVIWLSDLRGFTRITDSAPPDEIIPFLNDYAEVVIDAVHGVGGNVLKLIGDGVLAIFRADPLADACAAALEAEAVARGRIAELTRRRAEAGLPVSAPYVGLHVGEVFYGNIGSQDRLDFTVVGPAVNEASRICAMCRSVERDLLVSSTFHAAASESDRSRLASVGRHALRGVGRAQDLYTLDPQG
jgi:adenylate cyclase